jgi:hypothetical protein
VKRSTQQMEEDSEKMKTYLTMVLVFAALGFASVGQAFATGSPGFSLTSSCEVVYKYCGPAYITVTSLNGFSGTVNLSTTVTPYCTNCSLTATMNPSSVSVSSGGYATSKLQTTQTCHFSQQQTSCEWDVTITGTSGTITNTTDVLVCVGNYCRV